MSDTALRTLAQAAGVLVRWHDYRGQEREVGPETLRAVLAAMELPCATPAQIGSSLRRLDAEHAGAAAGPARRAPGVDELAQRPRIWGITAQLYSLRRAGDGGLGDFTSLADLARALARHGADTLAISPVHAPFVAEPGRFSPYMPSSRLWLNPWYVDPDAAARALGERAPGATAGPRERDTLIDWPAVASPRIAALRALYEQVAARLDEDQEFRAFRHHGGELLEDHARFEALHARQLAEGGGGDWRRWPAALRDPRSAAVAEFARAQAHDVRFHVFLQYLADRGLAGAQAAARYAGMAIGLLADLAVGVDPAGSEAWSRTHLMLRGLCIGAPPDPLNTLGQNWGLTTFSPVALARTDAAPLLDVLRAALRHAGAVRIDHVLGLNRLWVIPEGAGPLEGAYLRYPLGLLLDRIAAEAQRHQALVIGEDLGTVPEGLHAQLEAAGVMGLRVLWFMRQHGMFVDPSRWPASAVATTTTHDLPTVAGWWQGRDLEWRERTGQYRDDAKSLEHSLRVQDRQALWDAFRHAGIVSSAEMPRDPGGAIDAAIRYVARAPARLVLVPLEDIAGLVEQPNLPGTIDEHPNWRRRLPGDTLDLLKAPAPLARLAAVRGEREPEEEAVDKPR